MMEKIYYVYILKSKCNNSRHYTGITENLEIRLKDHNSGRVSSTAAFRPWEIETYIAFSSQEKAIAFEEYLKSHSGRAFASKHL